MAAWVDAVDTHCWLDADKNVFCVVCKLELAVFEAARRKLRATVIPEWDMVQL
jgi:hypothetical protein